MRIFRTKAATDQPSGFNSGGWRRILEPFSGAWQRNVEVQQDALVTSSPTLFACLDRISSDVGKLPWRVKQNDSHGIPRTVDIPANAKALEYPNDYQTPDAFRRAWILSKLQHGNALILKAAGQMFVLDWANVQPLISESGSVFYRLSLGSKQNLLPEAFGDGQITIPASDVIHDRGPCLYHQLIGVPPVTAAYWTALKSYHITRNNAELFSNGSVLGGLLTVPAGLSDEDAKALKDYWQNTKPTDTRVVGADAKYTPFGSKAVDSQVVEQLQLSDKSICQPFGIPPFIVGAESLPSGQKPAEYMRSYFVLGLQQHVNAMETLLTRALNLPRGQYIQLDTDQLLRMDQGRRAEVYGRLVTDGIYSRNEARAQFDLPPVKGGDQLLVQQQDVPLSRVGVNDA
ncbi:phage portal protein [Salinisphaera sp. C84B14]|uniref:phage portal protein n=1 Tax=Salinisphaera sp. C84B14 TaxID=1304155 RepID=UPI00333E9991